MNNTIKMNIHLDADSELVHSVRKKKQIDIPPYNLMGNAMTNHRNTKSFDITDEVIMLSTAARRAFKDLWKRVDHNKHVIEYRDISNSKASFYSGINELIKANIIIRLQQNTYMFNPWGLIHYNEDEREKRMNIWINNGGVKP